MHGLTKLTRIAIALVAAMTVACPPPAAAATKTICVGLVVDARALHGPVSSDCTTVRDGSTGYDVLRAAGHTVEFRRDGLICSIDSRPADGCAATDAAHFWAYFHREPGSSTWQYSNEGATTYRPANSETEGWVWRNDDEAKPENVPYRTICPQPSSPSPSPSPHRSASPPADPPTRAASGAAAAAATHPSGNRPGRHQHAGTTSASAGPTATDSSTPAAAPPTSRPTSSAVSSTGNDDPSGPPYGLMAGAVVVAGLGGVAAMRWRRRGVD